MLMSQLTCVVKHDKHAQVTNTCADILVTCIF